MDCNMNGDESWSSKVFGGGGRRSFVYSIVISVTDI